jgi:hypothetical protein
MRFEPEVRVGKMTLDAFHEWNVEFALAKFKAKTDNDIPVNFINYKRDGHIIIWEPEANSEGMKAAVYSTVRAACRHPGAGVEMVSLVTEAWVAVIKAKDEKNIDDLIEQYGEVRNVPGHEDALMVITEAREGGRMATKWVVKLKKDPAKNIVLARDDANFDEMKGRAVDFFPPVEKQR